MVTHFLLPLLSFAAYLYQVTATCNRKNNKIKNDNIMKILDPAH